VPKLTITTASLPSGSAYILYTAFIAVTGGTAALTFSATGLPANLTIAPSTGVIAGVPAASGTSSNVVVTVTDSGTPAQTATATFSITILQPVGPPVQVTISPTSIGQNLQALVTLSVQTAPPTGSGGVQLTLTSNNPNIVLLNGGSGGIKSAISVTIPENETSVAVIAEGVAIGQTTFTASGTGYLGTGTVTVTPSGFTLSGPNGANSFYMNTGQTANLTVTAVQLDSSFNVVGPQPLAAGISPCQGISCTPVSVTVPLTRSSANGTFPSSVTFNSGDTTQNAVFTAVSPGTDVLTASVPTAPAGFSLPAGGANSVTAIFPLPSCTLPAVTVGRNLETSTANDGINTVRVTLAGQAPSALQVVVSILDSSKALLSTTGTDAGFSSITLTVPAGSSQTPPFYVYGVGTGALGSTSYTANTGAAFGSCSNTVTLAPSGFIFSGPDRSPATKVQMGEQQQSQIYVTSEMLDSSLNPSAPQPVAGGLTVNVNVTSSDLAIGTILTSPVQFTGGQGIATTILQSGTKPGSATLAVPTPNAPPGFSTPAQAASLTVTVSGPIFGLCGDQFSGGPVPIGYHLEIGCSLELSQPAPAALTVTLNVTSGSNLLLSSDPTVPGSTTLTLTIPSGGSGASYNIQALACPVVDATKGMCAGANSTTATYSASAPGYASESGTVTVTPSGVALTATDGGPSFTASKGGAAVTFGVSLVQLDPNSFSISNFEAFAPIVPGDTLSVSLNSDNTSAGTVTSAVTFPAGSSSPSQTPQFTPGTIGGVAHITAVEPSNFIKPANFNTVTATVQ